MWAAFVDESQSVELELTRVSAAGGRHRGRAGGRDMTSKTRAGVTEAIVPWLMTRFKTCRGQPMNPTACVADCVAISNKIEQPVGHTGLGGGAAEE